MNTLPALAICIENPETFSLIAALDPSMKMINYRIAEGWWLLINSDLGSLALVKPEDLPKEMTMELAAKVKVWNIKTS